MPDFFSITISALFPTRTAQWSEKAKEFWQPLDRVCHEMVIAPGKYDSRRQVLSVFSDFYTSAELKK
jgi:hypothetical protein